MSDIFHEVEEDLRAERLRSLATRYGWLAGIVFVLLILGAGGWEAWRWNQQRQDAATATAFMAAMRQATPVSGVVTEQNQHAALEGFEAIAATATSGYRDLARLRVAALKADMKDLPGALSEWDKVASDPSVDPLLRDAASLAWVQRQLDTGDAAVLEQRLQPLTAQDNPFHGLAQEAQALIELRLGHEDAAKAALKKLAQDTSIPEGVRGRVNGIINRLGG